MKTSIKIRALKLAHNIKTAYTSFSSALRVAYRIIKCDSAKRQVMRGLQRAYTLCEKLGLVSKSDALFNAFLVLLDLPAMPALKKINPALSS